MKKFFIAFLSVVLFVSEAFAAEITVNNVTIPQKGTALMEVYLTNTDVECVGFQFEINLPQGIQPAVDSNNNYILEKGSRVSSLALTIGLSNKGNNKYQFLGYQGSGLPVVFPGTEGQVLTILLKADDTVNVDDVLNASLSNIRITDTSSTTHVLENNNFNIIVTSPPPKTELLETATTVPEATTGEVELIVHRTIKANEWSTICLPFSMTEAQTKAVFGEDVRVCDFVDYEVEVNSAKDIINITVNFEDFDLTTYGFEANHPYLIKVADPISEFEVTAKIEPDEENAVIEYDNGKSGSRREVYGTFYGTLHAGVTIPANGLFISGNNFWYSTGSTSIKAFRGYFEFDDVLSSVEGASIKMNWNVNGDPTAIDVIDGEYVSGDVYSLQGILIGTDLKQLPKGVYIVGGKKVLVK